MFLSYPMSTSSCLKGRLPSVSSRKQMPERFIHAEIISAINREQSIFGIDNILKKCQMKHPNFTWILRPLDIIMYLFSKSLSRKCHFSVWKVSDWGELLYDGDCLYKRPLLRTLLRVETGRTSHLRLLNDFWFVFTTLEIPQITDVLHSELSFISI